jgi:hypothetical protein
MLDSHATTKTLITRHLSASARRHLAAKENIKTEQHHLHLSTHLRHTPGQYAQLQKESEEQEEQRRRRRCRQQQQQQLRTVLNPKSLMDSIQKKAALRRKRLTGVSGSSIFCLSMPRFDLTFDVVTMNKMILLELVFKYLPQFILQWCLNTAIDQVPCLNGDVSCQDARGWTTSALFTCVTSGISLVYAASGSYRTWKNGSWAMDLPDLDQTWINVCEYFHAAHDVVRTGGNVPMVEKLPSNNRLLDNILNKKRALARVPLTPLNSEQNVCT